MNSFKDMLKYLRRRDNLTQQELADKVYLSRSRINNYEQGIREPDFETLELFADFFNVDMNFLLGKSGSENDEYMENLPTKEDEQINEEDRLLLDLFHRVPDEDKRMVLNMIRAALGNQE